MLGDWILLAGLLTTASAQANLPSCAVGENGTPIAILAYLLVGILSPKFHARPGSMLECGHRMSLQ